MQSPDGLERLASWIRSHGLDAIVAIANLPGQQSHVYFTCHDRKHHHVTTLRAAREALGY